MSATFNWAYKPGVTNKYGITIPSTADNVRPSGIVYIALFGNDLTGNGSRQYPYRTMSKAFSVYGGSSNIFIFGSGVWREDLSSVSTQLHTNILVGDGDVAIDYSYYGWMAGQSNASPVGIVYNITMIGSGLPVTFSPTTFDATECKDAYFTNTIFGNRNNTALNTVFTNCIFDNYPIDLLDGQYNNCTFYNMSNIVIGATANITNCIFHRCNISVTGILPALYPRYSLFYQCNFRFNATKGTAGPTYPTLPTGFTYYSVFSDMTEAYLAVFSTANIPFPNCIITDPKFNNVNIADYSLAFDSPAKNLSYFGNYVGARSIAQALNVRAIEADGDFDFSSAVNVTIADDSITLTDQTQNGIIETKVIENTLGRQIKSIPILGFNADRNGQYIDSIADFSTTTYAAGDTLPAVMPFIVENGSITYNSSVYLSGQRGTTVSGVTAFSTTSGGIIREIVEAPQRHTVELKLSDVQPFTTEAFNHFEPGIAPTTNNVGDSRTGDIIRGNGDPAYVRGSTVEFPVNKKYIKIRFTIQANNLKP